MDFDMRKGRRRPDKITAPETYCDPISDAIFHAVQTLDHVVVQMDEKWGVDRLPALVSAETAAKFGSARAKLDAALERNDDADVVRRCSVLARGYAAMDAEAERLGRETMKPHAWVWRDENGNAHAFVRGSAEAIAYAKQHPGVSVFTMAEISRLARFVQAESGKLADKVKTTFPGAEVVDIRQKEVPNDELPF